MSSGCDELRRLIVAELQSCESPLTVNQLVHKLQRKAQTVEREELTVILFFLEKSRIITRTDEKNSRWEIVNEKNDSEANQIAWLEAVTQYFFRSPGEI